jgi:hypothetical protein
VDKELVQLVIDQRAEVYRMVVRKSLSLEPNS